MQYATSGPSTTTKGAAKGVRGSTPHTTVGSGSGPSDPVPGRTCTSVRVHIAYSRVVGARWR